jgi:hypothetical protein
MNERRNSRGTPDQQLIAEDSLFDSVTKGKPFEMKINFSMLGPEDSMRIFLSLSDKECDVSLISGFPCRILKEHDACKRPPKPIGLCRFLTLDRPPTSTS